MILFLSPHSTDKLLETSYLFFYSHQWDDLSLSSFYCLQLKADPDSLEPIN